MSGSGRKDRVMIACVTFETAKVTEPVKYYACDRVHIIHYTKATSPLVDVFRDFYDTVCDSIHSDNPTAEIIEHNDSVSNFSKMLALILSIIEGEQDQHNCDIFINISAGSPEYSAAAAIGAMMSENVLPFSVNSKEYSVSTEEAIKSAYYCDGKPVGLTVSTYEPRKMSQYTIEKPPEHLVRGLRILDTMNKSKKRTKSSDVVPKLKDAGIWIRDETTANAAQSDAVSYHRDFVSKWLDNGWVYKDELRKRFYLTDEGTNIIDTFYLVSKKDH